MGSPDGKLEPDGAFAGASSPEETSPSVPPSRRSMIPASERINRSPPVFPDTLRPPPGAAVPPATPIHLGPPPVPRFEALDEGLGDDADDTAEDELSDEAPAKLHRTAAEKATARKEKARKRAVRKKSREAAALGKQKQKKRKKSALDAPLPETADPRQHGPGAESSPAPVRIAARDWKTIAAILAALVALGALALALLSQKS
jgi:hypothetical protein